MQNEDVTLALYEISNAVNTTSDLHELYEKIHQSLGRIIDTSNFYIAIYESKEGYIHFPYFVDRKSKMTRGGGYYIKDRKASMTLRVIETGQSFLIKKQESIEYCSALGSEPSGPVAEIWIGRLGRFLKYGLLNSSIFEFEIYLAKDRKFFNKSSKLKLVYHFLGCVLSINFKGL